MRLKGFLCPTLHPAHHAKSLSFHTLSVTTVDTIIAMKKKTDPRHKRRKKAVQQIFAKNFNKEQDLDELAQKVWQKRAKLDPLIEKVAPEWPLEKLNRIDLAILRLAVYEMTVEKREPLKVIIDEAVELSKELGGENSPSFVNGVLGTIVKEHLEKKSEKK